MTIEVDLAADVGPSGPLAVEFPIVAVVQGRGTIELIDGLGLKALTLEFPPSNEVPLELPNIYRGMVGNTGWSPLFAVVADGERRVYQVIDWVGGTGPKPPSGQYLGPTGPVSLISSAVDMRGHTGEITPALIELRDATAASAAASALSASSFTTNFAQLAASLITTQALVVGHFAFA